MSLDENIAASASAGIRLRQLLAEIHGIEPPDHIVLAPGILVSLRLLFGDIRAQRLLLSSHEYHSADHFPGQEVRTVEPDHMVTAAKEFRPHAVIASPVTWWGRTLPVGHIFTELRSVLRDSAPLLVADCSHAGAVGYPSLAGFGADLVCGDAAKWLLPPVWQNKLAFLWTSDANLFAQVSRSFEMFFLAMDSPLGPVSARWLGPSLVQDISRRIAEGGLTRSVLLGRHQANMDLARQLASELAGEGGVRASILWFREMPDDPRIRKLQEQGLVWEVPGKGVRVLCRADALVE